jgi:DNA-binding YbaB/EbfC family protein
MDNDTPDPPVKPDAVEPAGAAADPVEGALGGLDLGALLDKAGQVQQQIEDAQAKAADTVVTGTAGGGAVQVMATGAGEFQRVVISPEVLDDVSMLQDLVLAAVRDTMSQVQAMQSASMGGLGDAFGGLGDLFGG